MEFNSDGFSISALKFGLEEWTYNIERIGMPKYKTLNFYY